MDFTGLFEHRGILDDTLYYALSYLSSHVDLMKYLQPSCSLFWHYETFDYYYNFHFKTQWTLKQFFTGQFLLIAGWVD